MSANVVTFSPAHKKPTPSPKPRRVPPQPPSVYSVLTNTSPSPQRRKPPVKPKPRSVSSVDQLSPCHKPPPAFPTSSSQENLLSIDSRPRLNTPRLLDKQDSSSDDVHPQLSTPEPVTGVPLIVDKDGMATVTTNHRPAAYCVVDLEEDEDDDSGNHSVSIKIAEKNPSSTSSNTTDNPLYDTTTHRSQQNSNTHPSLDQRYSSFNRSDNFTAARNRLPEYDEIDINKDNKRPVFVQTTGYATLGSSTSNERASALTPAKVISPPHKPYRPDVPPKPSSVTQASRKSTGSPGDLSSRSPSLSPAHATTTNKGNNDKLSPSHETSQRKNSSGTEETHCLIDIDALVSRAKSRKLPLPGDKQDDDSEVTSAIEEGLPTQDSDDVFVREPLVRMTDVIDDSYLPKKKVSLPHMYETLPWDIQGSHNTAQDEGKPKRRKAPPPPVGAVGRGSPTLPHREKPDDITKSLTLGRKPRNLIVTPTKSFDDSYEKQQEEEKRMQQMEQPNSPSKVKKGSQSPGNRSKFKLAKFMRGYSKDDGLLRSSLKKKNKKAGKTMTPTATDSRLEKSLTLPSPARPRGKSLDPYMCSSIEPYSSIEYPDDDNDEVEEDVCLRLQAKKSPSPQPEAFAYSIIDAKQVTLRPPSYVRKDQSMRRSRSVEHLYESYSNRSSISPLATREKSPSLSDEFNSTSHIYSVVKKPNKQDSAEGREENNADAEGRSSVSPIRDVSHVTTDEGRLYAVVTKQSKNEPKTDKQVAQPTFDERDSSPTTPPPPLPPSRLNTRQPPPRPAPYRPMIDSGSGENSTATTVSKAADKYSQFLNSPPPNKPVPVPPEQHRKPPSSPKQDYLPRTSKSLPKHLSFETRVKPATFQHAYDEVEFDETSDRPIITSDRPIIKTTAPSPRLSHGGKIRPLKPKDKPAPPPPQESMQSPNSTTPNSDSQFLFKQERSFIEVGEGSLHQVGGDQGPSRISSSTSDGTISTVETAYFDSDSSEFESSDEDDEDELKTQPTVQKSKTYYIAEEILTTERTFVRGLTLLHKDFRSHMLSANNAHEKTVVTEEVLNQILSSNLGGIYQLNFELLKELEERLKNWDSVPKLGDIFVKKAPFLKLYSPYISNFDKALKILEEQTKRSPVFAQVLKDFETEPKCNNLSVSSYLLETVQRIPRYKLLLADYIKHLPADSDDREDSEKAYDIIASVALHVNDTIKQIENFRKIIEVSKKLIGDVGDSLISPHRKLLKEGELVKSSRKEKQPRMFFLFTDLLVYASAIPPANTTFRVIKRIPLDGMKIQLLDDPEMKYAFQIISTCKSFRLEAGSSEERDQWMKAFEGAIRDHFSRIESRKLHRRSVLAEATDGVDHGLATLGHFAPPWLPDSSVSMCQLCGIHFTVTRRRHHCRACGMIFCGDCSSYAIPLPYKNNKFCRVCQTCYTTLSEGDAGPLEQSIKVNSLKGKPKRLSQKKISMPSVLREVRARDDSAQISGYLFYRKDKSRQWKKKWFVVYNLVMYEFKRHEDVTAKQSIPLPSYTVGTEIQGVNDPLVFSLEHSGAGRIVFKADDEDHLERWVTVLQKAVRGETDISPASP